MSGDHEIGRPSYGDGRHPLTVHQPLPAQFQDTGAGGSGRRRGRPPREATSASVLQAQPADQSGGRQAKKKGAEPRAAAARTVYVPVPAGRGIGYGLWRLVRFVVLIALWLALTIFKVALSPFVHIMGGSTSRRPRWSWGGDS